MDTFKKILVGTGSAVITWLMLSFVFFPAESAETSEQYFAETIAYMAPLKIIITLIFVLFAVFMYEQKTKKKEKDKAENIKHDAT